MELGVVIGSVWATRKLPGLGGMTLLLVQTDRGRRVAADILGAGVGDRVLLTYGQSARSQCPDAPVDTSVAAILDERGTGDVRP